MVGAGEGWGFGVVEGDGGIWTQDIALRDRRGGHSPGAQFAPLPPSPGPAPCPPLSLPLTPDPDRRSSLTTLFWVKHRGKRCPMLELKIWPLGHLHRKLDR